MKFLKNILLITIILTTSLAAQKSWAEQPPKGKVWLYKHVNYGGGKKVYSTNKPSIGAEFNDKFSSIKVGPGTEVILFEHNNYNGRKMILTSNDSNFVDDDFNDIVSSIELRPAKGHAWIYKHNNYGGRRFIVSQDKSSVGDFNDEASSIKVGPNTKVILYKHNNYEGRDEERTSNDSQFGNDGFNDMLSSVKIEVTD